MILVNKYSLVGLTNDSSSANGNDAVLEVVVNNNSQSNTELLKRQSNSLSQKLKRILESVVCLDKHPRIKIQINFDVLSTESDFSSLICHMINLGSYVFLEAGVSIKDTLAACVCAMNEEGNLYILDPSPKEKSKS